MYFLDTKMHMVIFCVTLFEVLLLFFQVIYFLERRNDAQRLRYLVLLVLLIAYNVCSGGVLPDEEIPISIVLQNILAYLLGFSVSMYAIYFYYKLFELKHLKFLATKGLFYFLFASFLVFFVLPYAFTGNLERSRQLTMVVPFFYGIWFVASATRALLIKIRETKRQGDGLTDTLYLAITAYFSMMCWATVPTINFFGDYQLLEHSVTNSGFILMSIFYIRSATKETKEETEIVAASNVGEKELALAPSLEGRLEGLNLSVRERQVLNLILKGLQNKEIADILSIAESTVGKHSSNIYLKTGVTNRTQLVAKFPVGAIQATPGSVRT